MSKESHNSFHIDIELLKALEQKAKQSNLPVNNYIEEILRKYILNESNLDKQSINDERFNQAENLFKDNKKEKEPIQNSATKLRNLSELDGIKIKSFDKEGIISATKATYKVFKDECFKRDLNNEDAVKELIPLIQKYFDNQDWEKIINMFTNENVVEVGSKLAFEIFTRYGNKCPLIDVFHEWTGKRPEIIEEKLLEAIVI